MTNSVMLQRLMIVYGEPDSGDPGAYLREVGRLLQGYTEAEQQEATDLVLKTHRGRQWPTPAECVNACIEVRDQRTDRQVPEGPKYPEWTESAFAAADRLINSEIGRQAAREGWIGQLHDFCRKARHLPDASVIADLRREARKFDEAYAFVQDGGGLQALNGALRKLGESFLDKRDRLSDRANGASS